MYGKASILLLLALIVCVTAAYAADMCITNEPCIRWGDIYNGSSYYPATEANATLIYPNGTEYGNLSSTEHISGRYFVNFTTNVSGNFYIAWRYYSGSIIIARSSETFNVYERWVGDTEMTSLSIILGFIAVVGFIIYIGRMWMSGDKGMWRVVGTFVYIFAGMLINAITFFMMKFSEGESYYPVTQGVFIVTLVCLGGVLLISFAYVFIPLLLGFVRAVVGGRER